MLSSNKSEEVTPLHPLVSPLISQYHDVFPQERFFLASERGYSNKKSLTWARSVRDYLQLGINAIFFPKSNQNQYSSTTISSSKKKGSVGCWIHILYSYNRGKPKALASGNERISRDRWIY